jgi:hypothetical protein
MYAQFTIIMQLTTNVHIVYKYNVINKQCMHNLQL